MIYFDLVKEWGDKMTTKLEIREKLARKIIHLSTSDMQRLTIFLAGMDAERTLQAEASCETETKK